MISIVYCTRQTNPEHKEHLIKSSGLHKHVEIIEIVNNGESLTTAYNRGLNQAKYDIVVFCHDDILLETKQWGHKLLKMFSKHPEYGIIGVAGTKFLSSTGQWWENRKKMYGRVAHTHEGKSWLSSYSDDLNQELEEVVLVDGVFFAVDKSKIKASFNEKYEGFHFYDVTFCVDNYLKGVKVGVTTMVRVNHKSIGMTNEAWEANRVKFSEEYKDSLPIDIKRVLRKGQKLKVMVACMSLGANHEHESHVMGLIKSLKEKDCDVTVVSNFDKAHIGKLKSLGVKPVSIQEPPGFKLGDGQWKLKSVQGEVVSQPKTLYKLSDVQFDILHISGKPVADHILRLYPDTSAICTIYSGERSMDEPVINPQVKKYIAINEEVKEILIDGYGIDSGLVELANPETIIEECKLALA